MEHIISKINLENVDVDKLRNFIQHWKKIKDLPCENIVFKKIDNNTLDLELYYSLDIFDHSVTQFMTVLFGELSFVQTFGKVKFVDLKLPKAVYGWFHGPKFGAEQLKRRFGAKDYPLLVAIIKPSLGKELTLDVIDKKIKDVLNGGFHAIKDDEMQGNLSYAPLKQRIILAKKYRRYIPALNLDNINDYEKIVNTHESEKVGMILVNATTTGFPTLYELRKITKVPILSHVAMQGVYDSSFSPKVLAMLHRLFGCDAFTNPIGEVGYFDVSREEEKEMALEFTKKLPIKKTLPLLTGGARLNNLTDIIKPYEKQNIPYGVVFGSLVFDSDEKPTKMCEKVVEHINKYKK